MTTAQDILAITPKNARELFKGDAAAIKARFRELAKEWHPDHNKSKQASQVIDHLSALKEAAIRQVKAAAGAFKTTDRDYLRPDGVTSRVKFLRAHSGDLGDVLVTPNSLVYEIRSDFKDVADAEVKAVAELKYADDPMRDEISRYMPTLKRALSLPDKEILFFNRPADTVLLADLVTYCGGKIPAVHVAWIVSSLMNLASYLCWSGVVHGAIGQQTVLICPEKHAVMLVGGWGYSTAAGARPKVLPVRTSSIVPRLGIPGEVTSAKVDLDLIKATAQEILGATGGTGLKMSPDVPSAMVEWLLMPSSDDTVREYQGWMDALEQSFGQRRFVDMSINPADIYATLTQ